MPEGRDIVHAPQPESVKPKIEKFLKATGDCLSGKITPVEAFRQISNRPVEIAVEKPIETPIISPAEITTEQHQTNHEIQEIRQEIIYKPIPESLIIKDEYYLQKERAVTEQNGGGFIDYHKTQHEEFMHPSGKEKPKKPTAQLISVLMSAGLRGRSREDAQSFYNVLHERGYSNNEIRFISSRSKNISGQEIAIAIDRINKLGITLNSPSLLRSNETNLLQRITNIPEENFQRVSNELNPYFFLNDFFEVNPYNSSNDPYGNKVFLNEIIKIYQNGEIDPKIKEKLEMIKAFYLLSSNDQRKYLTLKENNYEGVYSHYTHPGVAIELGSKKKEHRSYGDGNCLTIFADKGEIHFEIPDSKDFDPKIFNSYLNMIYENLHLAANPRHFIEILSPEQLDMLSAEDKGVILFIKDFISTKKTQIYGNPKDYDDYEITRLLEYLHNIKDYIQSSYKDSKIDFLTELLEQHGELDKEKEKYRINFVEKVISSEFFKNTDFSGSKNEKFWELIKNNTSLFSYSTYKILFNNTNNPDYFSQDYIPTSKFYELFTNPGESLFPSDEIIKTFPESDKSFWNMIKDRFKNSDKEKQICEEGIVISLIKEKQKLIINIDDVNFIDGLFGQFGKKANEIIKNYIECVNTGVITPKEKNLITDFLKEFRIISPAIIGQYKEAKLNNNESVFISYLKEITEKMTSSQPLTEADRQKSFYLDLIKHVYTNNVDRWTTYESNASCDDRSVDISQFSIQKKYQIDLLSQSQILVKDGEILNPETQIEIQKPIDNVLEQLKTLNFDKQKCLDYLSKKIGEQLSKLDNSEIAQRIKISSIKSPEDQLFLLLAESVYGDGILDIRTVKELMIAYEFINYEDIRDYINGTNDRISIANNRDYALLCELDTFYSDRIKDINKRIIETAIKNGTAIKILPEYFKKINQKQAELNKQTAINKLQFGRLGLSQGFLEQINKTLNRRGIKKYTIEETKQIIERYEKFTHGLTSSTSTSQKSNTQAFYGQVKSQREKTFTAASNLGQEIINPQNIHLGEINLKQLIETERDIQTGQYNEEQFTAFTAQKFMDIFIQERSKIETELDKFISESGKKRETLTGYITKTKENANARMVGGVCVSGDNPDSKVKEGNMWNMPEYFQFVFQDPETLQCQGLVLMHHFVEKGKKVLTVSLNPSSTYLYSVDETALLSGILSQLETFASANNFDLITVSQSKTIRTNRTGGNFEKAIDERIKKVGKTFKFKESKQFSYKPGYFIQEMDILWENNNN